MADGEDTVPAPGPRRSEPTDVFTVEETAAHLRVCERTVWKLMEDRKLGYVRDGRTRRILRRHIDEYFARCEVPARSPQPHSGTLSARASLRMRHTSH